MIRSDPGQDFYKTINLLEETKTLEIVCAWDVIIIGRPKIMNCYCTGLENNYGTYNYSTCVPQPAPILDSYHLNEPWDG